MKHTTTIRISEELLSSIATSFSNIFFECVLIVNMQTNNITYLANTSGLSRRILKRDLSDHTFKYFVETISGKDVSKIEKIIFIIKEQYLSTPEADRPYLLFMTDLNYSFDVEGKSLATYKFCPISLNAVFDYLIVSIGFSVGQLENKVLVLNTKTEDRLLVDITNRQKLHLTFNSLTPIENAVLALSAQGISAKEIGEKLNKATETIKSVKKRIFAKLKVENMTEAILSAINHKIL